MILQNNDELVSYCSCGCQEGVHLKVTKDEDDGKNLYLSFVSDKFYSEQENSFSRLKEKLRRIWYILRNKEYHYFEIIMNENDIQDFKDFVEKI